MGIRSNIVRVHGGIYIPDPDPPREAHLELTTACNLDCEFCYRRSWDEKLGYMSYRLFRKILEELEDMGVEDLWFDGWGEPTYHTRFEEMAKDASKHFNLGLVTNGTLAMKRMDAIRENFSWVFVSVDVANPDEYSKVRVGSDFSIIDTAVRELVRNGVAVWISSILMKSTLRDVLNLVEWASDVNVSGILLSNLIATDPRMTKEQLYSKLPPDEIPRIMFRVRNLAMLKAVRIIEPFFEYRTDRRCPFIEERAFAITYDGKVVPCLFTSHTFDAWVDGRRSEVKQISFGDLEKMRLRDIWWSEEYVSFRSKVRLVAYPSCNDCPFWEGCDIASSNEYDCWGNSPTCSFCPYYRGIINCPRSYIVRWIVGA